VAQEPATNDSRAETAAERLRAIRARVTELRRRIAAERDPGFDGLRADVVESADTLRIVLDPTTPFASLATVEVRVVSATVGGEHALDETYTFRAEDRTAPKVLAAQATAPRVVHIGFDEPVLVVDPAGFVFGAVGLPAGNVEPVDAEADGSVVVITLDTEMTPDVAYEAVVTGVTDPHNNPVASPDDRTTFSGFRPPRSGGASTRRRCCRGTTAART
jgi:hypothetical protein